MRRLLLLVVALCVALPVAGAAAQSASNGPRTLTVSKSQGLSESGERISVSGSGFDTEKGIYVALCVLVPAGQTPSPCGGGADLSGSSGSSLWISSNPPPYGEGLAQPYGEGGTFSGLLDVGPVINVNNDCRVVKCAIYTRSDHTRLNDRSQDVAIPVTFGVQAPTPTSTPTQAPPVGATATPTPTTVPPTATPTQPPTAPTVTLLPDGLTAKAGEMVVSTSKAEDLNPEGERVTVRGSGFDEAQGIFVALCAVTKDGGKPGPCSAGSADQSAWISSNPPAFGVGRAKPYGAGGSFEVELVLRPVIDGSTDCREVECAVMTRADDTAADDRSKDVGVPVTFAQDAGTPPDAATTQPAGTPEPTPTIARATDTADGNGGDDDDGGSSNLLWFVLGGAGVAIIGVASVLVGLRRRGGGITAMLAAVALVLGACGSDGSVDSPATTPSGTDTPIVVLDHAPKQQLPVTVRSADGREVTVTDTSRIVSLWGNITEVVYGLGLGDNVVGRDSSATFPEVKDLPLVTRAHDTSAEGVLALDPTLVLASKDNSGPAGALDQIRNVGVPVIVFDDPHGVDEIVPRIRAIAEALGVREAGEELVALTEAKIDAARASIPHGADPLRVAFLYMRGTAGVYLIAGPGSGFDSMIEAAGAVDAGTAMGLNQAFTPITSEALAEAAPDVILMTTSGLASVGGLGGLVDIPGIAQTPAGKDGRVITIEDSLLFSYGPRTHVALQFLIDQLYGQHGS